MNPGRERSFERNWPPPPHDRWREQSIDKGVDVSMERSMDTMRDRSFERNWPPPTPRDMMRQSSQLMMQQSYTTQQPHTTQQSRTMLQTHMMQQSNYLHGSDSGVREVSSSKSNSRAPSLCLTPPTMPSAGNLTMSTRMAVPQQLALDDQHDVVARSTGAIFHKSLSRASSEVSFDGSESCLRSNLAPPALVKPPQVARGLQISLNAHGVYLADGELYAYRPPQCSDLSRLVTYCTDGTELFQLPSLWMVLRPDDCPLVWIVLQDCANLPLHWTSGSQLTVEWAAPQAPDQNRLGCTVTGEAPLEAVLGLDEGLLRPAATNARISDDKQTRLLLNPQCGRIICRWLRHAQQVGIMI